VTVLSDDNIVENFIEPLPQVYNVIASWTRHGWIKHAVNGKRSLPVLSSLKDKSWLKYTQNELFSWNEVPVDFVDGALEAFDLRMRDGKNSSYGDLGKPVVVPKHLFKDSKDKMSLHQLNVVASDIMSLNRKLEDMRHPR